MFLLDAVAEEHIQTAMQDGAFDNLPGLGRPLPPDDAEQVPEELRAAYRILKNAGYVPPEVRLRREISTTRGLLDSALTSEEYKRSSRRLNYLMQQLAAVRGGGIDLRIEPLHELVVGIHPFEEAAQLLLAYPSVHDFGPETGLRIELFLHTESDHLHQ